MNKKLSSINTFLLIVGLAFILVSVFIIKNFLLNNDQVQSEVQLKHALVDEKPTILFFHSMNCDPCMQMIENVGSVYPEFSKSIVLVDVNVSDVRNHELLRDQGVRSIPSLMFYDRHGQSQIFYGVTSPEEIKKQIILLLSK
ncbi:MAG: thioredoxin family protein [Anaerolineaceae bacterium]|nr:thioredoxin family protein [Anaerolineaceae bacterium]